MQRWMVPAGMTSVVHEFDARVGGRFRISLTYADPHAAGKTEGSTDTSVGRFTRLVPDVEVAQVLEFETDDPALQGEMTITYALRDAPGGTEVTGRHEGLPAAVSEADNELGWRMSLDALAALVEARSGLTPRLVRRVRADFGTRADDVLSAVGRGVPQFPGAELQDAERSAAAVVLLARGRVSGVQEALAVGHADWRDLLVAGGLAGGDWRAVLDEELGPA